MNRIRVGQVAVVLAMLHVLLCDPIPAQRSVPRGLVWDGVVQEEEEHDLRWPLAVAASSHEEIAVIDPHGSRLIIFKQTDGVSKVIRSISLPGTPVDIAHDGVRYLVSLRRGSRLLAIEGERHQIRPVTLPDGAVAGALAAMRGGGFLVADPADGQVLMLDTDLKVTERVPIDGHVTALAAAPGGGFYAALGAEATVRRFSSAGEMLSSWVVPGEGPVPAWPSGLVVEPGGDLIVVDRHVGRIVILDAEGRVRGQGSRRGSEPGLLLFPAGIARAGDGRFLVADQGNGRVQLFRRLQEGSTP
jgi:hypothetical protein